MTLAKSFGIDRRVADFSLIKRGRAWDLLPQAMKDDFIAQGLVALFIAEAEYLDFGGAAGAGSKFRWRSVFGDYNLRIADTLVANTEAAVAMPSEHFGNLPHVNTTGTAGTMDAKLILYLGTATSPAAVMPATGDFRIDMLTYIVDGNCQVMGTVDTSNGFQVSRVGGDIRFGIASSGYGIGITPALTPAFSPGSVDLLFAIRRRADNYPQIDYCRAIDANWIEYHPDTEPLVTASGGSTKRGIGSSLAFWNYRGATSLYGANMRTRVIAVWNKDPTGTTLANWRKFLRYSNGMQPAA